MKKIRTTDVVTTLPSGTKSRKAYKHRSRNTYKQEFPSTKSFRFFLKDSGEQISKKHTVTWEFTASRSERSRFAELREEIDRLGKLASGWNSYDADPPNSTSIYWAQIVLEILSEASFYPSRIAPSAEGGVGFIFAKDNLYADIECLNTGEILAVTSSGQARPYVWSVSPDRGEIKRSLEQIRVYLRI